MDSMISSCHPSVIPQTLLVSGTPDASTANGIVAIANPDRLIQSDQPEQTKVPLSRRLIFPFKVAINRIGFIATGSLILGLVPGIIAGVVAGIATAATCGTAFLALGGLVQLISTLAGRPSKALEHGFNLGRLVSAAIAALVGGVVAVAAGLPVFGAITAAEGVFHFPIDIYRAARWTEEDMSTMEMEIESTWKLIRDTFHNVVWDDDSRPTAPGTKPESDKPELTPPALPTEK